VGRGGTFHYYLVQMGEMKEARETEAGHGMVLGHEGRICAKRGRKMGLKEIREGRYL